jgi:hypothetical protein
VGKDLGETGDNRDGGAAFIDYLDRGSFGLEIHALINFPAPNSFHQ